MLPIDGRAAQPEPLLRVLDVPFVTQSESLCGGAAAAMVLRYWGARGVDAESFAHLVDARAGGIQTAALVRDLNDRGWTVAATTGSEARLSDEINRNGRPVLALIEDRPGINHYVVVVATPARGIIFHDPARTPYRVMSRDEFTTRWRAASMWMAVVVPRENQPRPEVRSITTEAVATGAASACDALVAHGVRSAQAGDYGTAERTLTSALSCPGPAAYRELAGLRVLQKRWPDAEALAATATEADVRDVDAWRLLATARFVQDDRPGALDAWNNAGEPAIETVQVIGLTRTRVEVAERALDLDHGEVLTQEMVDLGRRRLADVPAIRAAAVEYAPTPGGRAEVRAVVRERSLFPSSLDDIVTMGGWALFSHDARVTIGSMSGAGERLDLQYRFRPGRPRIAGNYQVPAPWGGVWNVEGSWEQQPFNTPLVPTSERTSGRLGWGHWVTSNVRIGLRAGGDHWNDIGARGSVGATAVAATLDDRLSGRVDLDTWFGSTGFSTARAIAKYRSSNILQGFVAAGSAGGGVTADGTPAESWFAGDSGNARPGPVPLRGHGLVEDGKFFRIEQMGRTIVHGSAEGQYWWRLGASSNSRALARLLQNASVGMAVFVDAARVTRRFEPGDRGDVDAGVGLRISMPNGRGFIRLDYGRGILHDDSKLSFGFTL